MDRAVILFSRKGLLRETISARHIRSREHARKLWPLVEPDTKRQLVTWVSPVFEDDKLKTRSHFRRLPGSNAIDLKNRFDQEETERQQQVSESVEHAQAKRLLTTELERRIRAGLGLPWAFKDDSASDFPLIGNLLLGATKAETEYKLQTPFGCHYRLDIAVLGDPIHQQPLVVGGIEIERWHHFDGRKALIGRSTGFPLITVDITKLGLNDLTEQWATSVLSETAYNSPNGQRSSYIYLHDLLYPQFICIPREIIKEPKHQYLVFADDATIERLGTWIGKLAVMLGFGQGQVALQKLNATNQSARVALEEAGSIVGADWQLFNNQRFLRVSIPRPRDLLDVRAHKLHTTLAKLLLSQDCLIGYRYGPSAYNIDQQEEDVWLHYQWHPKYEMREIHRILPKRLAEPIGRLINFLSDFK